MVVGGAVFLVLVNLVHLENRIIKGEDSAKESLALVEGLRRVRSDYPLADVSLWLPDRDGPNWEGNVCQALGLLHADRVDYGRPQGRPPVGTIWVMFDYGRPPGARIQWQFGEDFRSARR